MFSPVWRQKNRGPSHHGIPSQPLEHGLKHGRNDQFLGDSVEFVPGDQVVRLTSMPGGVNPGGSAQALHLRRERLARRGLMVRHGVLLPPLASASLGRRSGIREVRGRRWFREGVYMGKSRRNHWWKQWPQLLGRMIHLMARPRPRSLEAGHRQGTVGTI